MDARALALALPLTARAVARIPATGTTARYPTARTHAHPASSRRYVASITCSLPDTFAPARQLLWERLRTGPAAEAHGRTLAAADLGFRTDGPDLALALSFPVTAGTRRSPADGLATALDFHKAPLAPGTTETTARFATAPPHAQPASSGRDVFALACCLPAAFAPARELLREHVRTGSAAEAHGRTLLAARDLRFHTHGRDIDLALALSFPVTAGALRSTTHGLGFGTATLAPATTRCLAVAQDEGVQGACPQSRFSVVCRAHPLGTASPTPLQPDRPRTMFRRPRLPMEISMLTRTASHTYVKRCTPVQNASNLTGKEQEHTKWTWNTALGYLLVAAKSKPKFHVAVGAVLLAGRVAFYLAGVVQKSEFISNRVKLPQIAVTAAAMAVVVAKSVHSLLKETKDLAGLVIYSIALYNESVECGTADGNKAIPSHTVIASATATASGNVTASGTTASDTASADTQEG